MIGNCALSWFFRSGPFFATQSGSVWDNWAAMQGVIKGLFDDPLSPSGKTFLVWGAKASPSPEIACTQLGSLQSCWMLDLRPCSNTSILCHCASCPFRHVCSLHYAVLRYETSGDTIKVVLRSTPSFCPELICCRFKAQICVLHVFFPLPHTSEQKRCLQLLCTICALAQYMKNTAGF